MKSLFVLTIISSLLLVACSSKPKTKKSPPPSPQVSYVGGTNPLPPRSAEIQKPQIEQATRLWSDESKSMLDNLIDKYGQPQEANDREVTWFNNGQWDKTILSTESGTAQIRQTATMTVPPESLGDLATYNKNIAVDQAEEQVTVSNTKEELNYLALNLGKEVVDGRMSPFEARRKYSTLAGSLNRSSYLESLSFGLPDTSSGHMKQSQEKR